jgi:hypothetical protein
MNIETIIQCLNGNRLLKSATYYVTPKLVTRVTRRFKYRKNSRRNEFVVTIGQPNYLEAKFTKTAVAAGEPFPIKKLQFKEYPQKKCSST